MKAKEDKFQFDVFGLGLIIGLLFGMFLFSMLIGITGVNTKLCETGQLKQISMNLSDYCKDAPLKCLSALDCSKATEHIYACEVNG